MGYYIFLDCRLARRTAQFQCEWLINGEWKEDKELTLALEDALMDYGDFSIGDQVYITPEMAEELVKNGTVVLQGDIGTGISYYNEPKFIQLSDWKKPDKKI